MDSVSDSVIKTSSDVIATLARHDERIEAIEKTQEKQNDSLQRLEAKIDKIYLWLIGLMGGIITSLLLLIAQFVAGGK
jgi:hypothetical protein